MFYKCNIANYRIEFYNFTDLTKLNMPETAIHATGTFNTAELSFDDFKR